MYLQIVFMYDNNFTAIIRTIQIILRDKMSIEYGNSMSQNATIV